MTSNISRKQIVLYILTILISNITFAQTYYSCMAGAGKELPTNVYYGKSYSIGGQTVMMTPISGGLGEYSGDGNAGALNGSCVFSTGFQTIGDSSAWSITFSLSKGVNNLTFMLGRSRKYTGSETITFTTNGGSMQIIPINYPGPICNSQVSGNQVKLLGPGSGGNFVIKTTSAYTKITISGSGGGSFANGLTFLRLCEVNAVIVPAVSGISPNTQTVCTTKIPAPINVSASGTNLTYQWYKNNINSNSGGVAISGATGSSYNPPASSAAGTDYYYAVITNGAGSVKSAVVKVVNENCDSAPCYKPSAVSSPGKPALISLTGISSLKRTGLQSIQDNWPAVRKGAWLVLESQTKGFILNKVDFDASGNPVGIPPQNFVEGMAVYDRTNQCLKLYTTQNLGVTYGWYCMATQACPE
ncbi:hypothetical protein [Chryseobacterium sp. MA9]|uniref:hypothetical protein n=1 Tax=Chryseobacterium sp. MA9 TaxID=2966625 RepID=UPI002107C0A9|nr:hypothetical protein [Chryseobacterium sp. MA9]UTX48890.1 hypothetical protein KIK00_01060 [Chryseobacterium sp. MA9]